MEGKTIYNLYFTYIQEDDRWNPEPCTVCECKMGELSCQTLLCPQSLCSPNQYKRVPKGECCPICEDGMKLLIYLF